MRDRWMTLWGAMLAVGAVACGGATAPAHGPNEAAQGSEVAAKETPPTEPQAAGTPKANDAGANAPKEEPKPEPVAQADVDPATQEIANSPGAAELEEGAQAIKRSEWVKAQRALEAAVGKMSPATPLDAQMAGHALIGRACAELHNDACAAREFKAVLVLFQPDASGGDGEKQKRTDRALLAAGEALFYVAEQKRKEVDKLVMPAYGGSDNRESVAEHVRTKVADWAQKKRALVEEAEKAYGMVLALAPAPPPRWAIAAASREGVLWGKFTAEFRAAPIPKAWTKKGPIPGGKGLTYEELRGFYYEKLDEASAPQLEMARSAFKKCSELSQKLRYTDSYAQACDSWLAKSKAP